MTTTTGAATPIVELAPPTAARKVAAGAAVLFAIGLFMTVASVDVPHDPTNAELLHWWQQSGNRTSGLVSGLSAVCAAVFFAVVMNYLRSLRATAKAPQWMAFASSMGAAVTALWLVTGAARAAISHLVDVMGEPLPGTDVLRYATALNYTVLGLSGMGVLSLSILAVSVVVLRTNALGPLGRVRRSRAAASSSSPAWRPSTEPSRHWWPSPGRSVSRSPSGVSRSPEDGWNAQVAEAAAMPSSSWRSESRIGQSSTSRAPAAA